MLTLVACHSTSSSDAEGSASAAPTVSSWPILPADPVDAMTAADEDPIIVAYARKAGSTLTPKFRDCINHELPKNPKLTGSVIMVANVNSDGTVASVKPVELQGYNAESMKCLTKAISSAHFPPPPADHTIIKMPFKLTSG
ncbi:MAG: AgmX/PglI C-terminal domain-containing protein [Polyangiaceae bacterium]